MARDIHFWNWNSERRNYKISKELLTIECKYIHNTNVLYKIITVAFRCKL